MDGSVKVPLRLTETVLQPPLDGAGAGWEAAWASFAAVASAGAKDEVAGLCSGALGFGGGEGWKAGWKEEREGLGSGALG
jgi:hypothetical protein